MARPATMYERVGGEEWFDALTLRFYSSVRTDSVLRPLYPEADDEFEAARRHLCLFLIQFWGGPARYNDQRGHPRLRLRHQPFAIGPAERDAWITHMTAAVKAGGLGALDEEQMLSYFRSAAEHMVNRVG